MKTMPKLFDPPRHQPLFGQVQRSFYSAQQNLITARLQEASNQILLYRVLGGGWQ